MKVLFFAPHSAIWVHAFPEALVAEALAQQGDEIVYVGCGGLLKSHCVAMSAVNVGFGAPPEEKEKVCRLCRGNRDLIRKDFRLAGADLESQVEDADRAFADAQLRTLTPENLTALVIDGVEVGRIALYELLLQQKKSDLKFSEDDWRRYQASVRNCLLTIRIVQRILDREKPDRILVYNSLYSVNRVVCRLAELRGIPQFFLHAGMNLAERLSTLYVARGQYFENAGRLREKWRALKDRPASARRIRSATNHLLEVFRGRSVWAYSSTPDGSDLRAKFRIEPGQKLIVATLSSQDELLCGEIVGAMKSDTRKVFASQVDWLRALIAHVARRSDLALIIRVHPREFPNKRESVLSGHVTHLKALLSELPPNVRVNWPTDNVSLYDLANLSDAVVNGWSTAGKEMAWLGLPVVLYSAEMTDYPPELNYVGTSESDYFEKIDQALRDGWNPERIRMTYRWCAIEYSSSLMDISDSFSPSEPRGFFARGVGKVLRSVAPYRRQRSDLARRAPRLACAEQIRRLVHDPECSPVDLQDDPVLDPAAETALLRQEVGRLVEGLYGTAQSFPAGSLADRLRGFSRG